jgi:hypothetical protein
MNIKNKKQKTKNKKQKTKNKKKNEKCRNKNKNEMKFLFLFKSPCYS